MLDVLRKHGSRDSSTEASLGCKSFGTNNKDRELYTFNDKNVSDFITKSLKGGRCGAFNSYFESKQLHEIMLIIKKHLERSDNESSNIVDEYLKYNKIKRDDFKLDLKIVKNTFEKWIR